MSLSISRMELSRQEASKPCLSRVNHTDMIGSINQTWRYDEGREHRIPLIHFLVAIKGEKLTSHFVGNELPVSDIVATDFAVQGSSQNFVVRNLD